MSAQPENPDPIQRLLSLKRHEVPPPRFFNDFSGRVIAHLDTPEKVKTWWQRWGFDSDLQPALVCGMGMVVSSLLVFGILASFQIDETQALVFRAATETAEPMILTPPGVQAVVATLTQLKPLARPESFPAPTFPLVSTSASESPFGQFPGPVQRISWGGN